jgi:hypothetical protein
MERVDENGVPQKRPGIKTECYCCQQKGNRRPYTNETLASLEHFLDFLIHGQRIVNHR